MELDLCEKILQTYTLEEIAEYNELTPAEFLDMCLFDNIIRQLPNPKPLDVP